MFFDYADAIAGDLADDLSLPGCFDSAGILREAITGTWRCERLRTISCAGCLTEAGLLRNLRAVKASRSTLIVRLTGYGAALICRALDRKLHDIKVSRLETARHHGPCLVLSSWQPEIFAPVRAWNYGLAGLAGLLLSLSAHPGSPSSSEALN